jgi:hypothetical protein
MVTLSFYGWLLPLFVTIAAIIVAGIIADRTPTGSYGAGGMVIIFWWFVCLIVTLITWLVWALLT